MITTVSIILILIGLFIIAFIILKKFPALAILDVENIPGQKEAKFKEEIIKKRLERGFSKWGKFFINIKKFFSVVISGSLHKAQIKLRQLKDNYRRNKKLTLAERREQIRNLFRIAEDSLKVDDLDKAEASLIEIVSLEQKNLPAFFQLAEVYSAGKKWPEARQTLGYSLKLCKSAKEHFDGDLTLQKIYFSLALVNENLGDYKEALDNVAEALELEPNSPRYLDLAISLAITVKNKNYALTLFERLQEVNPENAKLTELLEEISSLSEDKTPEDKTIY